MKLNKQCAPEYQSLIRPKKKMASEAKDFRTASSVSCPSPRPRPRLPRPRLVASNFCGLKGMPAFWQCILEALCSWHFCWCENGRGQNWKKKQKNIEITQLLEEFKTAWGGFHFLLTNHLDRFLLTYFFPKKKSWCIIGSVIWSLDVKAWS